MFSRFGAEIETLTTTTEFDKENREQVFIFAEKTRLDPYFLLIEYFAFIYFIGDYFKPAWSENGRIQANQRGSWKWQKASHTH